MSYKYFMEHSERIGAFTPESLEFQRKVLERSGLGEETYLPEGAWFCGVGLEVCRLGCIHVHGQTPVLPSVRGQAGGMLCTSPSLAWLCVACLSQTLQLPPTCHSAQP